MSALDDLGAHVAASMTSAVEATSLRNGELALQVRADQILPVLTFLRDDPRCQFTTLVDICGVDYPEPRQSVSTSSIISSRCASISASA